MRLLLSSGLPKRFWGEVSDIVACLINRCPSTTWGFKTLQDPWENKQPDLSHLMRV